MFIPFGYILLIVSCTYISNLINSSSNLQETLSNKGYIDKGKYEGWYCTADEAFVPEDLTTVVKLPDGREQRVSTESNRPVEWFSEENYLFKLSKCREQLLQWMNSGKFSLISFHCTTYNYIVLLGPVVQPTRYYNLLKSWLEEDLYDLSISRPSTRLSWGIPVPNDPSQTIYVWLDALLNYLTVAKDAQQSSPDVVIMFSLNIVQYLDLNKILSIIFYP